MTMAEAAAATTPQATTNPAPGTAPAAPAQPAAVQRPGVISDQAYDALATPADRDRFARVKKAGDQGGAEWIERSQLEAQPADSSKVAPTGDNTAAVVDGKLQVGDMILSADDIKTLMTQKAANDLKATQVPPSPEGYTAELPKEFKVPPGIEYKFDTSNPAFVDARAWAHREGLTQSQFSQLLSFHANTQIAEQVQIGNAAKAELAKLGDHATARVPPSINFCAGLSGMITARPSAA
jgi:hypothetical protein